jgi:hypothetical protein
MALFQLISERRERLRSRRLADEQLQGGSSMSPPPIVRGDSLVPTPQLQPPAPDGRDSRPIPRRTPSGNLLVWNGSEFVKLPASSVLAHEEYMRYGDDII